MDQNGLVDLISALDGLKLLPDFDLSYLDNVIENITLKTRIEPDGNNEMQKNLFYVFC